ncbi:hypothetical protein ACWCQL_32510 [Streptomyces sp. NPDC002073]|uniref:hypothetical protein n=1 Tax=Streptomyces sp. NBC_00239 TaxID=2903640 RepID=UPI002E2CB412|nr:hypothetical protein [Streptomyces sp. NBC_00239]
MGSAPIRVHRLTDQGGRRVAVRDEQGHEQLLGIAYSDGDLLEFLRRAGLPDGEAVLDDPDWVAWDVEQPHEWTAP